MDTSCGQEKLSLNLWKLEFNQTADKHLYQRLKNCDFLNQLY